ncbi:MAG TPA: type II toxin-antitoxin system RelE/ParE family toxin [Acetobacteraceae bacterium]|nr:type II toxin-antitoxin system RelE/ParE family toxin [Acetobacteraceae bacterium]
MPRALRYTAAAVADLDAIRRWQTQPGSGTAALRRLLRLRDAIRRLRRDPARYPVGEHPGVREMPTESGHRVMYVVAPDTGPGDDAGDVLVLRVFGPGQSRTRL